jgi:hypothetical protein
MSASGPLRFSSRYGVKRSKTSILGDSMHYAPEFGVFARRRMLGRLDHVSNRLDNLAQFSRPASDRTLLQLYENP